MSDSQEGREFEIGRDCHELYRLPGFTILLFVVLILHAHFDLLFFVAGEVLF